MVRPGICGSPDAKAAQTIATSMIFEHMAPPRCGNTLQHFPQCYQAFLNIPRQSIQHGNNIRAAGSALVIYVPTRCLFVQHGIRGFASGNRRARYSAKGLGRNRPDNERESALRAATSAPASVRTGEPTEARAVRFHFAWRA